MQFCLEQLCVAFNLLDLVYSFNSNHFHSVQKTYAVRIIFYDCVENMVGAFDFAGPAIVTARYIECL